MHFLMLSPACAFHDTLSATYSAQCVASNQAFSVSLHGILEKAISHTSLYNLNHVTLMWTLPNLVFETECIWYLLFLFFLPCLACLSVKIYT